MTEDTTPAPSGEYVRMTVDEIERAFSDALYASCAEGGETSAVRFARMIEARCERALEAARAERDMALAQARDFALVAGERSSMLRAVEGERDALKAENERLSGEVDQSLIAQAFSERDAARAALREIADGGWCDSCRASDVAAVALRSAQEAGRG